MGQEAKQQVERLLGEITQTPNPASSMATTIVAAPVNEPQMRATLAALPRLSLDSQGDDIEFAPIRLLGEGGMGRVELALQRSLRREVAVKQLKPQMRDPVQIDALLREALLTGLVEHPSVIPIHCLGRDDLGRPVLVMRRVEGNSWKDLLKDPRLPALRAAGDPTARHLEILMQVCDAIHFAHAKGVLHRDLKPDNVMLGDFGEVYVLDWGVALRLYERGEGASFAGTPAYLAPEMLDGTARLSERTDVYLLGAILHEILTGQPPHQGTSLQAVLFSAAVSEPKEYGSEVPEELARICRRAMHADPAQRFESAAALRVALAEYLRHRGAARLSAAAEERRRELSSLITTQAAPETIRRLSAECRFGFQQALREWPEGDSPRTGLRLCLEQTLDFELTQQSLGACEALLAEFSSPLPPALRERVEALRRVRGEEAAAKEKLAELRHQSDISVSSGQRAALAAVIIALNVAITVYVAWGRRSGALELSHSFSFVVAFCISLLLGATVYVGRGVFLQNNINRQLFGGALMLSCVLVLHRGIGWYSAQALSQMFVDELLMLGACATLIGLYALPMARYIAAIFFGLALLGVALPDYVPEMVGLALSFPFVAMVIVWRKSPPQKQEERPPIV